MAVSYSAQPVSIVKPKPVRQSGTTKKKTKSTNTNSVVFYLSHKPFLAAKKKIALSRL